MTPRGFRGFSLHPQDVAFAPRPRRQYSDSPAEETEALLSALSTAEDYAVAMRNWYLKDKRPRRRLSKLLRAGTILFAGSGGLVPLVLAGNGTGDLRQGYVLIGIAGICMAFDRFFGVSSAWLRDITAAQALDALLLRLQVSMAKATAIQDPGKRNAAILIILNEFTEAVLTCVGTETSEWREDFLTGQAELVSAPGPSAARPMQ